MTETNLNLKVGQRLFVFQPETPFCKAHWVETTVITITNGNDFEVKDSFITFVGSDQQSWSEHTLKDQGVSWSFEIPPISLEEQEKVFWTRFFD